MDNYKKVIIANNKVFDIMEELRVIETSIEKKDNISENFDRVRTLIRDMHDDLVAMIFESNKEEKELQVMDFMNK